MTSTPIPDAQDPSEHTMTERQLAASVRFGRKIGVTNLDLAEHPLVGYLAGWDEENILLAIPTESSTVRKVLINRRGTAGIELYDVTTLSSEPPVVRELLESLISSFRKDIVPKFFPKRIQ